MQSYQIKYIHGTPDWAIVPVLEVSNYQWQAPLDITMQARLCHDGQNLHLYMQAQEKDILAGHTGPLGMVCEDSCMEFFFRPDENDLRYFNFEINPNAAVFIGFGRSKENLVRLIVPNEADFCFRAGRCDGGWYAAFTIPSTFIQTFFPGFSFTSGKRILANCYKCGHKTRIPHFITWNRVSSNVPSFHRPQDFGEMILE